MFKKIENAISDSNPPPAKRPRTDETVDNGDKAESDFGDTISSISGKGDEGDDLKNLESDKFEDELLKDSDDEQGEVMEAVEKELEDLLELELGDKKPEENAEKNEEVSAADDDKIDEDLENKLLEDDEVVPESKTAEVDSKTSENEPKPAEDKAVTELETAVPEEPATETNELEKEEPLKENDENRTKSPVPDEIEESPEKAEDETISKETTKESESPPEQEVPKNDATKSAEDDDDLLEACDSPEKVLQPETEENQQDDASVVSSTPDETPEESSDEKAQTESNQETKTDEQQTEKEGDEDKMEVDEDKEEVGDNNEEADGDRVENDEDKVEADEDKVEVNEDKIEIDEDETTKKDEESAPEPMETTDTIEKTVETDSTEKSAEENTETLEVIEEPKEVVPVKLQFMRKFAKTVGKISRPELEELLVQKITESLMFCSENTELRARLEKQEKLCEAFKKRLDNVVKQYNDLEMIHKRVMKDLKDRPEAPITPVKITRAVGLQVYQPVSRTKSAAPVPASPMFNLQSNKRPTEDTQVNGKSPENSQKKKKRITPLRPPLSATERASLEAMEAREEQKLRTNVGKSITSAPNVTLSPVANGGAKKAMPNSLTSSQSIDLTDDPDEESSSSGAKSGSQTPQPPALVAIRANSQQRSAYSVKPPIIVPANSSANRLVQFRSE